MSEVLDFGRVIHRSALLERLRRAQPHLIALIAPAGFGKSTLARQFIAGRSGVGICDCSGLAGDLDFARRILSALADENPERSETLSQCQLLLGDDSISATERVAIAIATWASRVESSTFVFENAERLDGAPEARDLFARLLRERPEARTVVICSRENLWFHLTRFAAPHRIVTLRAHDLAFERKDLDALFERALSAQTLNRIFATSGGWPIAVFLLARLACEGRLEALLERLGDVAFEELHDYLADEVLASLSSDVVDTLFAAVCIPEATDADVALATGNSNAAATLIDLDRTSPFVRRVDDRQYVVHPLIAGILTHRQERRRAALLEKTAQGYEANRDYLRAAELRAAIPEQESAARSLEVVDVGDDRAPSMRYSRLLSSLDRDLVRRYPTLWCCNALFQMFSTDCRQLLEETQYLLHALPAGTPPKKRNYVFATHVLLLSYLGRFQEALQIIENVAHQAKPGTPLTEEQQGYILYLRGTILARLGRIDEAERDLLAALPFAGRMDVMASAVLMLLGSDVERVRGNVEDERDRIEHSLALARQSKLTNFVAFRLAESAFSAWLRGDDEDLSRFAEELEAYVDVYGVRGFAFFARCARGHDDAAPRDVDLLRWVLCGRMVAAANARERQTALRHAKAAVEAGESYPNPFLQTLAALVMAELAGGDERLEHCKTAAVYAKRTGSARVIELVDAARDARESDAFAAFLRRFRTAPRASTYRIEVCVLTGTVSASGKLVHLGERELALITALSLRPQATAQPELLEMLWPDSSEQAATNALYACLHRLRNRLGDEGIVVRVPGGLRLCDAARVDLWELERRFALSRSRELRDDGEYKELMEIYRDLRASRPPQLSTWEWFLPTERHLMEMRSDLGLRLGRYAIRTSKYDEALTIAQEMIGHDACDEGAREIAISAQMALGDRTAALAQFRQYRALLMEELGCEPSSNIASLVGVSPARAARH